MKKRKSLSIVILVASLLLAVMLMDTWILYTQTHNQTKQAGAAQLSSVSGKLESSISDAEALTMEMAIKAREYLSDKDELEAFIYEQKNEIISGETGAFNLFIAGSDFCIIPDFDIPEDFNATERVWYTGAVKSKGKTYISSPYQDAMTGEICYTVSVMLGDGDAVLGVDYTMEGIRMFISQMADNAVNAVIVTDEGIIAGCSEEGLVGKKLINAMPDYAGIYASAKNKDGVVTGRVRDGIFYENLFACVSGSGWYLIVGISDWELYRSAYIQLAITIVLSLALFAMIVVLYLSAVRSALKTEEALRSREEFLSNITGELAEPLNRILERSGMDNAVRIEDVEEVMTSIHSSALSLSEMMGQIMSYKSIVASSKEQSADKAGREKTVGLDKKFRTIILVILLIVMILSLYTNISSSYQWGKARMENEAYRYEYQLSEWINTQKSLLDMFVSTISTNPEMLTDYEGTVEYLKEITEQYPEISVTYMTNPSFDHTVYMSNGWEPDEDWHVEERQWYIDTLGSETGWSISAPYYDEQTGGYCLTISKIVYDANTGEFLGIFGIDFFMDKLVDILGDSYTDDGYAFLVDPEGGIINHPYGAYQMSQDQVTNVQSLAYGETRADGKTTHIFRDYDSELKIQIAARNSESNFTVYVVADAVPFCLPEDKGSAEKEADGILELQPEGEADGIMEFSPDEEILEFSPDEEMDGNRDGAIQNAEDLTNALKSIGLNTDAALSFCGGDISLYRELLSDYVRVFPDRKREMDECFSLEDWEWKEFEVKIHGLKGTSKTIGASALSEKALILENAAEEHDRDVIRKLYTEFIEEYREMVNIIEDILKG